MSTVSARVFALEDRGFVVTMPDRGVWLLDVGPLHPYIPSPPFA